MVEDLYPSRVGASPRILARQDPVAYGGDGSLWPAQIEHYEYSGLLALPALLSMSEIDAINREIEQLAFDSQIRELPECVREPDSEVVRSLFRVHELGTLCGEFARGPRLTGIARQILGSDVYLHQTRVNYKPPFDGKEFNWHSDFETWHVEDGLPRMRTITIAIALTENTEFNGPLLVIPQSHRHFIACVGDTPDDNYKQSLRRQQVGVPDRDSLSKMVDVGGIEAPKGKPGSAIVFDCNILHGSTSNMSPHPRSNLFVVYNSVDNQPVTPFGGTAPRPDFIASRDVIPVGPNQRGPRSA